MRYGHFLFSIDPHLMKYMFILFFFVALLPLYAEQFAKGDEVVLIRDEPIYFKDTVKRQGPKGEVFTVFQHDPATHIVYVLSVDETGQQIALKINDAALASKQTNLTFKGLRLGMPIAEVDSLTTTSFWAYKFSSSRIEMSKPEQQVFLKADLDLDHKKQGDKRSFGSIGHSGRPGDEMYYYWDYACVYFHDSRVYKISVNSYEYSADKIDSHVKTWLEAAKQGLTEKYGEPHKTFIGVPEIGIANFHTGFTVPVCDWVIDEQRIVLGIQANEAKFSVSIEYLDTKIENTLKKQDKIKTDL